MASTTDASPVRDSAVTAGRGRPEPPWWTRRALAGLWLVAVAVLAMPRPMLPIPGWVDGSWQAALGLVRRAGLHWGSDVIFTYGPAGFLSVRVPYFAGEWLAAVAAALAVEVGIVACVALLLAMARAPWWQWLVCGAALVLGLHAIDGLDATGPILIALLFWAALVAHDRRHTALPYALCTAAAALAGIVALVKGSGAVAALLVPAVFVVAMLLRRGRRVATVAAAAFAVALAATWFGTGQRLADAVPYLHASFETLRGYASAQWYQGVTAGIVAGSVLLAAMVAAGAWLSWQRRRAGVLALMSSSVLLLQFKDSFVRDGPERDATFFAVAAVLALPALAEAWNRTAGQRFPRLRRLPAAAPLALVAGGLAWAFVVEPGTVLQWPDLHGYRTAWRALRSTAQRQALEQTTRTDALDAYAAMFPGVVADVGAHSLDVFPWDIGLFYAHPELHWRPRPVLASYQGYTPWLDHRDAAALDAPDAPDFVLYSFAAQNGQYPPFDEPAWFGELLARYRAVAPIGTDAVLMARLDSAAPLGAARDAGTQCVAFGTPVTIPRPDGRWVFASVAVHSSVPGAAVAAIWKPAGIDLHLGVAGGDVSYRFSPGIAADGVYLSTLFRSASDIIAAQRGGGEAPATISLATSAPWEYGDRVCFAFSSVAQPPPSG